MTKKFLEDCIELNKNLFKRWKEVNKLNESPFKDEEYLFLWEKYHNMLNSVIDIADYDLIHGLITYVRRNDLTVDYIIMALKALNIEVIE